MSDGNNAYFSPQIGQISVPLEIDLNALDLRDAVLVRSTNWLGDAIMTLPGVYQFFQACPSSLKSVVLCPKKLESFWQAVPWVDQVVAFEKKSFEPEVLSVLRSVNPGFTAVLPNSFGSAWHLKRANLPNLFGRRGRLRSTLLDHKLPVYKRVAGSDSYHQARHYLEFATAVGSRAWGNDFLPMVATLAENRSLELLPFSTEERVLVLAPGAAYGPAKQWPVESFRAVAEWWHKQIGPVVCTGAPNEADTANGVVDGLKGAINLAGKTSLYELVYIIGRSRCVVANDSGTMHLGGALQKDGVAIFGSTDPLATGPIGGRWVIKEEPLDCRPCLKRECPLPDNHYKCLKAISAESVIESLKELLA